MARSSDPRRGAVGRHFGLEMGRPGRQFDCDKLGRGQSEGFAIEICHADSESRAHRSMTRRRPVSSGSVIIERLCCAVTFGMIRLSSLAAWTIKLGLLI